MVEGNLHNRHSVRRPEPRRLLTRAELSRTPAPAPVVTPEPVVAPEPVKKDTHEVKVTKHVAKHAKEYSSVTPIYTTPAVGKVSASKLRASGPVMDYVAGSKKKQRPAPQHSHQMHQQVQPSVAKKSETIEVKRVPAVKKESSARNFDLLIAAELEGDSSLNFFDLGGSPVRNYPPGFEEAGHHTDPAQTLDHDLTFELLSPERTADELEPLPSHSLRGEDRTVLQKQFEVAARSHAKYHRRKEARRKVAQHATSPRGILTIMLVAVMLSGALITADSFQAKSEPRQVLAQHVEEADSGVLGQVTDGASTAPTTLGGDSYTVAADLAKYVRIPSLGVDAPVVSVGLTQTGAVDTPRNIWEAAWYNGSAKPGKVGQTFINGHASSTNGALFGRLEDLKNGDAIQIERGDGTQINYVVRKVINIDRGDVDMSSVLRSWNGSSKGLTLLTCDGEWLPTEQTLTRRVIVWADQV